MNILKPCLVLHSSFLILSCFFIAHIHGSKQSQALSWLYKSKLNLESAGIDTKPFEAILHANATNIHPQEGLKEKDRIKSLPGQPKVKFNQYGGYVTVDKKAGRAFFYYFAEADNQRAKDSLPLLLYGSMEDLDVPLLLMEQCSSLDRSVFIAMAKHFTETDFHGTMLQMCLFLESPAGVGFSYSNRTSNYDKNGDRRTAADNCVLGELVGDEKK